MSERSCQFCRIVRNQICASRVYDDPDFLVFMDDHPAADGHVLVVPKEHYAMIYDIPAEKIAGLFKIVRKIALGIKKTLDPEGLTIIQRNGTAAGQHVFHLHVHIIPRFTGRRLATMEEIEEASREKLDEVAEKIRKNVC